jgi:hypothetical protein
MDLLKNKLAKPESWTHGVFARDAQGLSVEPTHPTAVCWCLEGAITATYPIYEQGGLRERIARAAMKVLGIEDDYVIPLYLLNDRYIKSHEKLMEVLDAAGRPDLDNPPNAPA